MVRKAEAVVLDASEKLRAREDVAREESTAEVASMKVGRSRLV